MKTCLRSFAKYVPLDLVSKLIRSGHPAELGGEKQQVTILFADLANFTSLAEIETSEELVDVLDQYLSEMGNLITAGKGTVDKYIGDGIMAFWGAPAKTTSHALDACRAALIMKQKSKALWKNFKNFHHGIELSLRIGINTGVAIVGNFGSSARMNYTAIGDPVNLANRLESLNKFYGTQILIGPDTAKAVEPFFLLRPIDHVAVKGRKQVVLVYELLSEGKEATANVLLALKTYAEGLEQYTHRQFREAIDSFKRVIQLLEGKDPPSEIMIRKAQHYLERPPGSDWNGTTVLDLITPEQ
jgi:adenylate cyclase